MEKTTKQPSNKNAGKTSKTDTKKEVLTKEDFLKALKKATRPIVKPKASPSKGK